MPKVVKMVKKTADVEAPAPAAKPTRVSKPAATAPVEEPKVKAAKGPSRYKGVTTGMRVMEFQDKTLKDNFKTKLSDEEIAALWREEFPRAKKFDARIVRVVRRLFNEGRHGKQDWVPPKPLAEYVDGVAQPLPKPRAAKAEVEETEVEAAPIKKSKKR